MHNHGSNFRWREIDHMKISHLHIYHAGQATKHIWFSDKNNYGLLARPALYCQLEQGRIQATGRPTLARGLVHLTVLGSYRTWAIFSRAPHLSH